MGDISIIARRLDDGQVQYGWSGNGGYFNHVGMRLLVWYNDPELVEYLFGLGELGLIGHPGSEHGGYGLFYTHERTGRPHTIGTTEREIFSKIAFVDYGYLYDSDKQWYYVYPGVFRIKIPLAHFYYATNEGEKYEYDRLSEIKHEIAQYMFGDYLKEDAAFAAMLKQIDIDPKELFKQLMQEDDPLKYLYDHHKLIYSYFDDWVLAVTKDEDRRIDRYILKKKTDKHIETNSWVYTD